MEVKPRRHLSYQCETTPRQTYKMRSVKPGCGRTIALSTYKTESTPGQPWLGLCPWCGKKSRMDLRNVREHASRQEAVEHAAKMNTEVVA